MIDKIKAGAVAAVEASKKRIERLANLMRSELENLHGCSDDEYWRHYIDHEAGFVMIVKRQRHRVK